MIAIALAAAFAMGAWACSGWWPSLVRLLLLSPLIVPPIIYAVGMVRVWAKFDLLDTYLGVLIVHVVLSLPFAVLAIGASLANLDPRIVQAARSLGARPMTMFGRVILPNIAAGHRRRRAPRLHHLVGRDHRHAVHHRRGRRHAAAPDLDRHRRFHRPGARRDRRRSCSPSTIVRARPAACSSRTADGGRADRLIAGIHHPREEFR